MQMGVHETRDGGVRGLREIGSCDGQGLEERLLLRELTHRINNELASIIGFVTLTAAQYHCEIAVSAR